MTGKIDLVRQNLFSSDAEAIQGKKLDPKEDQELKEACEGFEAIFLKKIMESMRDTLEGDALFGESNSSSIYTSMYDQYLTDELSKANQTTGLKNFLYNQLKNTI
ncbi:rod-binding protein [Desulfospira joergensenii]|uniref:rod-binding protein n=1 Tax=Desulfospira joergensenii TaxID=53329 RepID=UPI0003B72D04|nr:rod-binding protein [Desulfospira joergensenii]